MNINKYEISDFKEFSEKNELMKKCVSEVIGKSNELKEHINSTLNILVDKDGFKIHRKYQKLFVGIINSLMSIYDIKDLKQIITLLKAKNEDNEFWDTVEKIIAINKEYYTKFKFINNMSIDEFNILLDELFNKTILYSSGYEENTKYSENEIILFCKILDLSLNLIIIQSIGKEQFIFEANSRFGIETNLLAIIWDKYNENSDKLLLKCLMRKINNLEESIKMIDLKIKSIESIK